MLKGKYCAVELGFLSVNLMAPDGITRKYILFVPVPSVIPNHQL